MAERTSTATRTNRALAALTVLALGAAGAAATWGTGPSASPSSTTLPATPAESSRVPGARPAETVFSWFDHGLAVEQFDYEMDTLSCELISKSITPDFCAVVGTGPDAFMAVGTEGFWDPEESGSDGDVWIPMNVTIFSMRSDNGMKRAVGVLDGKVEKQYTDNRVRIDVYTATIGGVDSLVLHKHLSAPNADPYDLFDEMQVIAASPTGAPTVVATYRGPRMSLQATEDTIEISALRYRPTADTPNTTWYSRVSLSYSPDEFGMVERVTSARIPVDNGKGMTKAGEYSFPAVRNSSAAT